MKRDEEALIARLLALRSSKQSPLNEYALLYRERFNLPVTQAYLTQAEEMLGFLLPPLLKRIYRDVGNGGFGPGYGLAPLFTSTLFPEEDVYFQPSLVHTTLQFRGAY